MRILAKTSLSIVLCLCACAAALPDAAACIDDGPQLMRAHYRHALQDNPWRTKESAKQVRTMDLLSLVVPDGRPADWQVDIIESSPGLLRVLSPQEMAGIRDSKRVMTMRMGSQGGAALDIGMLRPGLAQLRISPRSGKGGYTVFIEIAAREFPKPEKTAAEPADPKRPMPTC